MRCFHISEAAIGMIRNGVMSRVRTIPRPKNCRFSSSASTIPATRQITSVATTMTTVLSTASRMVGSFSTAR